MRSLSSSAGPWHLSPLPISKLRRIWEDPRQVPGAPSPPTQDLEGHHLDTRAGRTPSHPPLPLDDNRQNAGSGLPSCRRTVHGDDAAPPPGGLCLGWGPTAQLEISDRPGRHLACKCSGPDLAVSWDPSAGVSESTAVVEMGSEGQTLELSGITWVGRRWAGCGQDTQ